MAHWIFNDMSCRSLLQLSRLGSLLFSFDNHSVIVQDGLPSLVGMNDDEFDGLYEKNQ